MSTSKLTYGMQLPIQTLSQTTAVPWEHEATVDDLVTITKHAEATGMSFIGVCDHVAIPDDDYAAHMSTTWYDTVATLGFLAGQTSTIDLLSVVWIAPYRHPLLTASAFGTLGHLSGGRTILGVGAGHVENEFKALGVPYNKRGKILDECIDAVRATFGVKYADHEGERYSFHDVGVAPQPPSGSMPIWVGGMGEAAWRRAGRRGDGYIPMGNPKEQLPEIWSTIRRSADEAGRELGDFSLGFMPGLIHVGTPTFDTGPWPTTSGSAEEIADIIREALDLGATTLHLRFANRSKQELLDQIEAFGTEVAPLFG